MKSARMRENMNPKNSQYGHSLRRLSERKNLKAQQLASFLPMIPSIFIIPGSS